MWVKIWLPDLRCLVSAPLFPRGTKELNPETEFSAKRLGNRAREFYSWASALLRPSTVPTFIGVFQGRLGLKLPLGISGEEDTWTSWEVTPGPPPRLAYRWPEYPWCTRGFIGRDLP